MCYMRAKLSGLKQHKFLDLSFIQVGFVLFKIYTSGPTRLTHIWNFVPRCCPAPLVIRLNPHDTLESSALYLDFHVMNYCDPRKDTSVPVS